jgi:hypothetical protein
MASSISIVILLLRILNIVVKTTRLLPSYVAQSPSVNSPHVTHSPCSDQCTLYLLFCSCTLPLSPSCWLLAVPGVDAPPHVCLLFTPPNEQQARVSPTVACPLLKDYVLYSCMIHLFAIFIHLLSLNTR